MSDHLLRLSADARDLLAAAEQFERDAGDPAASAVIAPALASVEQSLHALSRACHDAARSIVPPGDIDESPSARFARVAAAWPGATPPSHEQQAQLLVSLHDAGAALRAAAESSGRAREVLAATLGSPAAAA